jgi:peptidoglycan-associated lipoprotein
MSHIRVRSLLYPILAGVLLLAGCSHNKVTAKAVPPPPAPSPTAALAVSPQNVDAGQAATLTWSTTNATAINIDGIGTVAASGSRQVSPAASLTYHLTASGQGGNADASARLTVTTISATAAPVTPTEEELFAQQVKDLYFDYDKYDLNSGDQSVVAADAGFFKQHSNLRFVIEGHCDERGSEEYNMALGDNRAQSAKKQLISMGVDPSRIKIVSYGKEKPFCTADSETCFQQNRRAHFTLDR